MKYLVESHTFPSLFLQPSSVATRVFAHLFCVFHDRKRKKKRKKEKKSLHFFSFPLGAKTQFFLSVISEEEKKTVSQQQLRSSGHREGKKTKLIFFLVWETSVCAWLIITPLLFPEFCSLFSDVCLFSLAPLFLPPSDSRKKGRISVLCLVS